MQSHNHFPPLEQHERQVPRVTAQSFPLPDRLDTFARPLSDADAERLQQLQGFCHLQTDAANDMLAALVSSESVPTAQDWAALYHSLVQWRSQLGMAHNNSVDAGRLLLPITDDSPNQDPMGSLGWFRAGSQWDENTQAWRGGSPTPASHVLERAGKRINAWFEHDAPTADAMQNILILPDGTPLNSNRLIRGATARQMVLDLKARVQARGVDVATFETGTQNLFFTETATEENRARIFSAAMDQLGVLGRLPQEAVSATDWAEIAYLLYQAPLMKRGSDAVIRVFLVAASSYLRGEPVVLPQDIDLQAYTTPQNTFIPRLAAQCRVVCP